MNKKYLAAATLVALAGLYLGCTNPGTVVDTAKTAADPRVPAGNATSPTSDVSGYWVGQSTSDGFSVHLAVHQNSDGTLIGEFQNGSNTHYINPSTAKSSEGTVSFDLGSYGYGAYTGTIGNDGKTMVLKNPNNAGWGQSYRDNGVALTRIQ